MPSTRLCNLRMVSGLLCTPLICQLTCRLLQECLMVSMSDLFAAKEKALFSAASVSLGSERLRLDLLELTDLFLLLITLEVFFMMFILHSPKGRYQHGVFFSYPTAYCSAACFCG